ncbi:hypothetical protein [Allonocardiopsis opalescens]|uniref:Uncharacterized protein n=1 Tax=Allonocardiopsis opalescens TaxID=1144618 RepID=A0A2T0PZV5_9ACTN|nr:hypothetical protein [Allonocardiopsis opalescens]PRX97067.1 hypothetical protein CLV72_106103 [Allonocardiopsis opalescens]
MAWSWRYEKLDGTPVNVDALPPEGFLAQGDAESWLGEHWRRLHEFGVEQVTLLDDTTAKYTMPLSED